MAESLPSSNSYNDTLDSWSISQNEHKQNDDVTKINSKRELIFDEVCSDNSVKDVSTKMDMPEIGMEFEGEEQAYDFYNNYGRRVGFSVRVSWRRKTPENVIRVRCFCCNKEGHRGVDKRRTELKNPRPQTRTGCGAHMIITLQKNNKYKVTKFEASHNHQCVATTEAHILKSQRRIGKAQVAEAILAENSGIRLKPTVDFMSSQVGGRENLGFLRTDLKNCIRSLRQHELKDGEAAAMLQYFQKKRDENPSFYYAIQFDEQNEVTNIYWADSTSILDFGFFGDVVCFDTTYKTNDLNRPFAPFVGVNHHKESVIFGAALLIDETASSFVWLFETFKKAMLGKEPKTILTDQDIAMANAIACVFPNTCHRICIWHMFQNAAKHLSHVFHEVTDGSKPFAKDFRKCVYDYEDEVEFLEAWDDMLEKYDLRKNTWLQGLFDEKEKWALVYGRENFCADMKSTQLSESLNNTLKRYLCSKYNILQFFHHFERVLADKRYNESLAKFRMEQTIPTLKANVKMLNDVAKIYTPAVFEMFQIEYISLLDYELENVMDDSKNVVFKVSRGMDCTRHIVEFSHFDIGISCRVIFNLNAGYCS